MTSPGAASRFVVFLLSASVIRGQHGWGVTYTSTQICALVGSTVEIHSSYTFPSRTRDGETTVQRAFWFTRLQDQQRVDVRTDPEYAGRVTYSHHNHSCTMRITELRESDSAVYRFRFMTRQPEERFTGEPGVTLTVKGFQVEISQIDGCYGTCSGRKLKCNSGCLTNPAAYVWYRNGIKIWAQVESFDVYHYTDSYSCSVKGHEDVSSPSKCVGQRCNTVSYPDRSICAFRGSSVDISCTYSSYGQVASKFWFSPEQSHKWWNPERPEDLSEDSQYRGRVQVIGGGRGSSTLRISDLRESDSAEYRFKFKSGSFEWRSSLPGTRLTVRDPDLQVQVIWSSTGPKLICHSSCLLAGRSSFVWHKNDTAIAGETSPSYGGHADPADSYSCSYQRYRSPPVYAPKPPSVSMSPPGDVTEGSSVTLSCSSDANPAAIYTWYKENQTRLSDEPQLVLSSIQSSESGQYYCVAENQLGTTTSGHISVDVKYAPKLPSVLVSPPADVMEGSSVTLSCSSDANPAANYTWYKENQTLLHGPEGSYGFPSISSEDGGIYYCKAENQHGEINSSSLLVDVQYAPKLPSVSMSHPSDVMEGSSVTLSCSSNANPAANYTWYKENQDSAIASGQTFTIADIRAEHSGIYYCEVQNTRGRSINTFHLTVGAAAWKSAAAGTITAVLLLAIALLAVALLWRRRSRSNGGESLDDRPQERERVQLPAGPVSDMASADECHYSNIRIFQKQEDALYWNVSPAQARRRAQDDDDDDDDAVEYTAVKPTSRAPGHQEDGEDVFALYSTVKK